MGKLPTSVNIFGKTCKIKLENLKDKGLLGYFDTVQFVIILDKNMSNDEKWETLLHEFAHAVINRSSVSITPNWSYEVEEVVVDMIAKALVENFKLTKKS